MKLSLFGGTRGTGDPIEATYTLRKGGITTQTSGGYAVRPSHRFGGALYWGSEGKGLQVGFLLKKPDVQLNRKRSSKQAISWRQCNAAFRQRLGDCLECRRRNEPDGIQVFFHPERAF
jgi:hypothetical protein